jgi:hypothetical protein
MLSDPRIESPGRKGSHLSTTKPECLTDDEFGNHGAALVDRLSETIDEWYDSMATPDYQLAYLEGLALARLVAGFCKAYGFEQSLEQFIQKCRDFKRQWDLHHSPSTSGVVIR